MSWLERLGSGAAACWQARPGCGGSFPRPWCCCSFGIFVLWRGVSCRRSVLVAAPTGVASRPRRRADSWHVHVVTFYVARDAACLSAIRSRSRRRLLVDERCWDRVGCSCVVDAGRSELRPSAGGALAVSGKGAVTCAESRYDIWCERPKRVVDGVGCVREVAG